MINKIWYPYYICVPVHLYDTIYVYAYSTTTFSDMQETCSSCQVVNTLLYETMHYVSYVHTFYIIICAKVYTLCIQDVNCVWIERVN